MKSTRHARSRKPYLLNAVAPSGRLIEPCVFAVAQALAGRAISYAEKNLVDPCVSINLLEEAAATVSDVIRAKEAAKIAPIGKVPSYLFRVFLRKLSEARRYEVQYEEASHCSCQPCVDTYCGVLDSRILLDQILGGLDSVTREMILRRIGGHSWEEIASELELSNHAARVRFSKALQRLRNSVKTSRNAGFELTPPRSKKWHEPRDRKAQRIAAFGRRLDRMLTPAFYREFHECLRAARNTTLL